LRKIGFVYNDFSLLENYKTHMFTLLPQLEVLDGLKINGKVDESEDRWDVSDEEGDLDEGTDDD
jgi:hypothetical protein